MKKVFSVLIVVALVVGLYLTNAWAYKEVYESCVMPLKFWDLPKIPYGHWIAISFVISFTISLLTRGKDSPKLTITPTGVEGIQETISCIITKLVIIIIANIINIVVF